MKTFLPSHEEMVRAFLSSNSEYDGIFFTGVRTTGIFCRPSCPAKKPLPNNVEFFPSVRAAVFAGYRPCKRCHPLEQNGATPEWVRQLLEKIEQAPTTRLTAKDLRAMGIDPARARRYFQKHHGLTFQAFCRGRRLANALSQIRRGADLDDVAFDHGYESNSGFREAFARHFGQPPGRGRNLECVVVSWMQTPLGPMIAGATDKGICLLEFTDRRMLEKQLEILQRRFRCPLVPGQHAHLDRLKTELSEYFEQNLQQFTVPLSFPGTDFQQRVWRALLDIPYGQTRSYQDLARVVGVPGAVRAVGTANGMNRIAILIPCHRVVNKSGELGGYGGGLWRKKYLLDLERGRRSEQR
ncbi:MAG: trifunctional transcriptional activator/DNA repair protein Ada/methylated-DNA--[protein]-cysteine S-methyltransferase [Verrucomicrobiota bacterium]